MQTVKLNNGVEMPLIGFGVYQIPKGQTEKAVSEAFECGCCSIDTAGYYGNEAGVGAAAASGIPRREIFLTTKLMRGRNTEDMRVIEAMDRGRSLLGWYS